MSVLIIIVAVVIIIMALASGWMRELKDQIDRRNAEWANSLEDWERERIERASETWRDTLRYIWATRRR